MSLSLSLVLVFYFFLCPILSLLLIFFIFSPFLSSSCSLFRLSLQVKYRDWAGERHQLERKEWREADSHLVFYFFLAHSARCKCLLAYFLSLCPSDWPKASHFFLLFLSIFQSPLFFLLLSMRSCIWLKSNNSTAFFSSSLSLFLFHHFSNPTLYLFVIYFLSLCKSILSRLCWASLGKDFVQIALPAS